MASSVVHQTSYEFPLDRSFFGQSFVIGDHVRHSELDTSVVSRSKHNFTANGGLGELQKRVANEKFKTRLVTLEDVESEKPRRVYDVRRTPVMPLLAQLTGKGRVAFDVHYMHRRFAELEKIQEQFPNEIDYFFHLHCLADLQFGNLNRAKLARDQRNFRDALHSTIDRFDPRFIAVSEAVRDSYNQHGIIPDDRITVVRNGVSDDIYRPASDTEKEDFRRELGIEASKLVGYVGRLEYAKGANNLLRVLEHYEENPGNLGFVIAASNGSQMGDFIEHAKKSLPNLIEGNRLKFCLDVSKLTAGFYSRDSEVCKHFYGLMNEKELVGNGLFTDIVTRPIHPFLDAYVHLSNSEALGLSPIEAVMSGVPVIASDIGGLPEVVNYGVGTLVTLKGRKEDDYVKDVVDAIDGHLGKSYSDEVKMRNRTNLIEAGFSARTVARKLDSLYAGKNS